MAFTKGGKARILTPDPEGVVVDIKYDENTGEQKILFSWEGEDGETKERWFPASELEPIAGK